MQVDKGDLLRRLRKIEGQVRGVQRMIEEDRYCMDILVQLAAIKLAIHNIGLAILEGHTKRCVSNAIRSGDGEQAINEMMEVLRSFVKQGGHEVADKRLTMEIKGMTCAACASRIEKGLRRMAGVVDAQVNLARERASVVYDDDRLSPVEVADKIR